MLCTTSLGGHLSWFETGGGRWFATPVSLSLRSPTLGVLTLLQASQFLMKMYDEIDLDKLASNSDRTAPVKAALEEFDSFKPMRRKLHIPIEGYH